jgi:hypothetical protein
MIKRLSRVSVAATLIALTAALAISPSAYASTRSSMSARSTASNAPVQHAGLDRSSISTVRSNASSAAAPATVLGIILQNNFTKNCMEFTAAKGLQRGPCNGSGAQEWRLATLNEAGTLVRFQNVTTGGCLAAVSSGHLSVVGCDPSAPSQQWWAASWEVNDVLHAWFQSNTDFGCLDDSTEGLRHTGCANDPRDNDQHQVWVLS